MPLVLQPGGMALWDVWGWKVSDEPYKWTDEDMAVMDAAIAVLSKRYPGYEGDCQDLTPLMAEHPAFEAFVERTKALARDVYDCRVILRAEWAIQSLRFEFRRGNCSTAVLLSRKQIAQSDTKMVMDLWEQRVKWALEALPMSP